MDNTKTSILFNSLGSGQIVYTPQDEAGYVTLYTTNADLFTVINYLWTAINKIDIIVRGANGEIKESGQLYDLTQRPNPNQSWDEFFKQYGEFKSVVGNSYIFTPRITGNRFSEMYVMPAQYTQVIAGREMFEVQGYEVKVIGSWGKKFEPEEILHIRESNLIFGQGQELYGMSRLKPGGKTVDTNQAAQDANANKQANRGVEGIVTMKGVSDASMGEKESNRLKAMFKKMLGGSSKAGDIAVTGRDLSYIDFGKSSSDLAILDTQQYTRIQLANLFLVPPILLDPTVANTYNNVKEAYKALYNQGAIPEVQQFVNSFNVHANDSFGGDYLDYDTSHIESLQSDMKALVEWVTKAPFTIDEMRGILEKEPTKEEIWMPNSTSPVSDVNRPEGMEDDKL